MRKSETIRVRTDLPRKDLWRRVAEEEGRGLSDWLRWLADQRVRELARSEAEQVGVA
jgi:hypothetical protein